MNADDGLPWAAQDTRPHGVGGRHPPWGTSDPCSRAQDSAEHRVYPCKGERARPQPWRQRGELLPRFVTAGRTSDGEGVGRAINRRTDYRQRGTRSCRESSPRRRRRCPTVARGKAERAGAIAGSASGSSVTDYVTAEGSNESPDRAAPPLHVEHVLPPLGRNEVLATTTPRDKRPVCGLSDLHFKRHSGPASICIASVDQESREGRAR